MNLWKIPGGESNMLELFRAWENINDRKGNECTTCLQPSQGRFRPQENGHPIQAFCTSLGDV